MLPLPEVAGGQNASGQGAKHGNHITSEGGDEPFIKYLTASLVTNSKGTDHLLSP